MTRKKTFFIFAVISLVALLCGLFCGIDPLETFEVDSDEFVVLEFETNG